MVLYLLNFRKHANQTELDQFFSHLNGQKHATQVVTKSAFFQARKQLSHSAFTDLNRQLVDSAYQSTWQPEKWRGFRLCAIDGSLSVQQDFYAKIVAANLTALMAIEAQDLIDKKTHNRQRKYQINYAQALTKMKHRIVALLTSQSSVLKTIN